MVWLYNPTTVESRGVATLKKIYIENYIQKEVPSSNQALGMVVDGGGGGGGGSGGALQL